MTWACCFVIFQAIYCISWLHSEPIPSGKQRPFLRMEQVCWMTFLHHSQHQSQSALWYKRSTHAPVRFKFEFVAVDHVVQTVQFELRHGQQSVLYFAILERRFHFYFKPATCRCVLSCLNHLTTLAQCIPQAPAKRTELRCFLNQYHVQCQLKRSHVNSGGLSMSWHRR